MKTDTLLLEMILAELVVLTRNQKHIMTSLDNLVSGINALATSVTGLTGSVDAAVTELQSLGPNDAQINALTSTVAGLTATVDAQTKRLADALVPPAPTV